MSSYIFKNLSCVVPLILIPEKSVEPVIVLSTNNFLFALKCLKIHINYQLNILSCISAVDFLYSKFRFCVVYDLLSLLFNVRLRIKIFLNEGNSLDSINTIFTNSTWWEREIWDFFGIFFNNNSDLRRILTDYGFEGFPLRKDFPISGFFEFNFNANKKRVSSYVIEFAQEQRVFNAESNFNVISSSAAITCSLD